MTDKHSESQIATAGSNHQNQGDAGELSRQVQALALDGAPGKQPVAAAASDPAVVSESKWDKFVNVSEHGLEDIPQGIGHALSNPIGLIENGAISIAMGAAAKVVLPECGPLGKLFAVGLGAYFAEQTAVPVYEAYKSGLNAKNKGELDAAGGRLGDALGGLAVNIPIGIYGYKFGTGIGDSIMASPKMASFAAFKADTLNPVNNLLADKLQAGRRTIAALFDFKSGRDSGVLRGSVEVSEPAGISARAAEAPVLPESYRPITENFSGQTVPGISRQFLDNLTTDDGTYYGAGLRYPDVAADPAMKQYLDNHNQLTLSRIDKDVIASQNANEAKAGGKFQELPPGWDNGTAKSLNTIDATDSGGGQMTVGSKTYSITGDGAPNRKVVVSDMFGSSKTLIPESKDFEIEQLVQAKVNGEDRFALVGSKDGASVLHTFDAQGKPLGEIQLPGYGTLHDVRAGGSASQLQFLYDTPISAPQALTLDLADNTSSLSALPGYNLDSNQFVTEKVMVPYTDRSGNAQEVPVFLSHARDMALNGKNPTMFEVYGGFDVGPQYLRYMPHKASWLMQGGVLVDPVLPGDGGLGSGNYQEGLLAGIENTDLAISAIVAKLKAMGISTPETNGIYGRSNGGMIVNTMLNRRSDLFGAAVTESGVNSLFDSPTINVDTGQYWTGEFGDPSDPSQAGWMSKLDVLNNLSKDKQYPPTLVMIGTRDGVVNVGNGITYSELRNGMNNGETLLYSRFGEGHDPTSLSLQTAFLWDRLTKKS